eukprot:5906650-Prymnesium_polylepis.1
MAARARGVWAAPLSVTPVTSGFFGEWDELALEHFEILECGMQPWGVARRAQGFTSVRPPCSPTALVATTERPRTEQ